VALYKYEQAVPAPSRGSRISLFLKEVFFGLPDGAEVEDQVVKTVLPMFLSGCQTQR
jgi:hypothetical protein